MSALEAVETASPGPRATAPPASLAQGLYERHSQRILGFCVRRLATREEAEDAVQTTFLYALRALQRGVVPVSETAWLFKIAENVCLAAHRTNGRRRARELADPPELADPASEREDSSRDAGRELVRALSTISEPQRKALLLREWRGLSYREISVQLGVSVGAVETLIFRARKGVAKALNGETAARGRVAGLFDVGAFLNTLKSLFGGSATAAKLAAAAGVVTIAALPSGDSAPGSAARTVRPFSSTVPASLVLPEATWVTGSARPPARPGKKKQAPRARTTAAPRPGNPADRGNAAPVGGGTSQSARPALPSLPTVPPLEVPMVPPVGLPELPALPALPELPDIPPPSLPVQLPEDPTGDLPALPQLP